jgi:hypothetical protein
VLSRSNIHIFQTVLESIPAEHRPVLDTSIANQTIETITGTAMTSIGTTFIPIIFTDEETRERIRVVLYAIVVPKLFMGMFIGRSSGFIESEAWTFGAVTYKFDFGQGGVRKVKGASASV